MESIKMNKKIISDYERKHPEEAKEIQDKITEAIKILEKDKNHMKMMKKICDKMLEEIIKEHPEKYKGLKI